MVSSVILKRDPDARVFFDVQPISGVPAYIRVFSPDTHEVGKPVEPIAYALFSEYSASDVPGDLRCCLLIHIWVAEHLQRRGYGSAVLSLLKETCDYIMTGMSTPEGRELCLKNGFVLDRGHFDRDMPKLIWRKDHAKTDKKKDRKAGKRKKANGRKP